MPQMKKLLFTVFVLLCINLNAQCDSTKVAKPGTYEIKAIPAAVEMIQSNVQINLTLEDLCTIESKRDNVNYVEWIWQNKFVIRISPRNLIKNKSEK